MECQVIYWPVLCHPPLSSTLSRMATITSPLPSLGLFLDNRVHIAKKTPQKVSTSGKSPDDGLQELRDCPSLSPEGDELFSRIPWISQGILSLVTHCAVLCNTARPVSFLPLFLTITFPYRLPAQQLSLRSCFCMLRLGPQEVHIKSCLFPYLRFFLCFLLNMAEQGSLK